MALQISGGASSAGTTSCTPTVPATVNAGNYLYCLVVNKYPTNAPSTPTGYTAVANNQGTGGVAGTGVDGGSVYATIFRRVADGTEGGSTVTVSVTSGNSVMARIFRVQSSAGGDIEEVAYCHGAQNTVTINWSVVMGPAASIAARAGDKFLVLQGTNTDAHSWSAEALTETGLTIALNTERSDAGTAQGQDLGFLVCDFDVTAGDATDTLTYTSTASGAASGTEPAGAVVAVQLREVMTATSAGTISGITGATTVEEQFLSSSAGEVSGVTAAASVEEQLIAASAGTISGVTGATTVEQQMLVAAVGEISGVTAAAAVEEHFLAASAGEISGVTAAATVEVATVATIAGQISGVTGDTLAYVVFEAASAGQVGGITAAAAAEEQFLVSAAGLIAGVTGAATVEVHVICSAAGQISGVTGDADCLLVYTITAAGTISGITAFCTVQTPTRAQAFSLRAEHATVIEFEGCYDGVAELVAEFPPRMRTARRQTIEALDARYDVVVPLDGRKG